MSTPEEAPAGRRVLVVEDNEDSRWSLCFLLRRWGHQVEEAPDGPEGLRLALDWRPEAAILDIGLPGLDGYEVARRVRAALDGHVLLIALTGYGTADDRRRAFQAGFDVHMTKPVDPDQLARLLQATAPAEERMMLCASACRCCSY